MNDSEDKNLELKPLNKSLKYLNTTGNYRKFEQRFECHQPLPDLEQQRSAIDRQSLLGSNTKKRFQELSVQADDSDMRWSSVSSVSECFEYLKQRKTGVRNS